MKYLIFKLYETPDLKMLASIDNLSREDTTEKENEFAKLIEDAVMKVAKGCYPVIDSAKLEMEHWEKEIKK
ncbi:MAG: hypothetical protein GY793_02050 [Proteobacteria bacterium]|nr:hypothetical protein [Pseudomonadota bacterium]